MKSIQSEAKSILGKDPDWLKLVNNIDRNNDGMIDFEEFVEAATNRMNLLNEEENLRLAFNKLDDNKDGVIDINEIKLALGKGK